MFSYPPVPDLESFVKNLGVQVFSVTDNSCVALTDASC
jgi:hypothetical protein